MQHEAVAAVAFERVNDLLVGFSTQSGNHQGLRLTAREQGRAVCAWQNAQADFDRANGARVTAIDTGLTTQNL